MKRMDYIMIREKLNELIGELSTELDRFSIPDNSGGADVVATEIDVLKKARAVLKLHGHD